MLILNFIRDLSTLIHLHDVVLRIYYLRKRMCKEPNLKCREDHHSVIRNLYNFEKEAWKIPDLCDPSKPTGAWSFNWFVIYRYLRG